MSMFGNGNSRSTRDRITRIETLLEQRIQQGEKFLSEFGELKASVNRVHDELTVMRGLPERVKALEEHKGKFDTFKNRVIGATAVLGLPVGGASAWTVIEKLGSFLRGHGG